MKKLNWIMIECLLLSFLVAGCGDVDDVNVDDADPIDEEFGMLDYGKADNNGVVRPNTKEADALLAFVNQPLIDDAAADAFEVLIDSRVHRIAAKNIVDLRRGVDGMIGTVDDGQFDSLRSLDNGRFVGRFPILRMFDLAVDQGFLVPSTSCNAFIGTDLTIGSQADLIQIENSRCDHFTGSVKLNFNAILLPTDRDLHSLDNVREIEGELKIENTNMLDGAALRGLTKVGRINTRFVKSTVSFPALKDVDTLIISLNTSSNNDPNFDTVEKVTTLEIERKTENKFPSLLTAELITINVNEDFDGLNSLVSATNINLNGRSQLDVAVNAFEKLETIENFMVGAPNLTITGFQNLRTMKIIHAQDLTAEFPSLTATDEIDLAIFRGRFDALQTANVIQIDEVSAYPFPELTEVADRMSVSSRNATPTTAKLQHVRGHLTVTANLSTFSQLETVRRTVSVLCAGGAWNGMSNLEEAGAVTLSASEDCALSGLNKIEVTGSIGILLFDSATIDALNNVEFVEFSINIMATDGGENFLPKVEFARDLSYDGAATLTGLDALKGVDDALIISGVNAIEGLSSLTTVGGNRLEISKRLSVADRDAFLNQLEQFSGSIIVR